MCAAQVKGHTTSPGRECISVTGNQVVIVCDYINKESIRFWQKLLSSKIYEVRGRPAAPKDQFIMYI